MFVLLLVVIFGSTWQYIGNFHVLCIVPKSLANTNNMRSGCSYTSLDIEPLGCTDGVSNGKQRLAVCAYLSKMTLQTQ
jgi:hypothetical protein